MTEVNRPLSLHLTSPRTSSPPVKRSKSIATATTTPNNLTKSSSTASSCSSSSSSSSSCSTTSSSSTGYDTPDSPSLILPYLYVGDQAQTQIDTISSLNISYILSLQSLPKFLDTDHETQLETSDQQQEQKQQQHQQELLLQQDQLQQQSENLTADDRLNDQQISQDSGQHANESNEKNSITKELLPSVNSSKDYLVKFKSCVNRLIKGKCINISDTFEQLVDKFFDETHNFIEEARRNKCNILVHCKAGISRSPTIAIAYLMKWKRLQLHEAYEFVKQCRPQISPNLNFMGQLINYEKQLIQGGVHRSNCASPPMLPSPTSCCLPGPYLVDDHSPNQLDRPSYEQLPILNVMETK